MHILHWHSSYYPRVGGIPRRVHNFCLSFPEHRHSIVTRAWYKDRPYKPNVTEDLGYAKIRRLPYRAHTFPDGYRSIYITDQTVDFINRSPVDVVIEHSGGFVPLLMRYVNKPIIVSAAADWPRSQYNYKKYKSLVAMVAIREREGAPIVKEFDQGNKYYFIGPLVDAESFKSYEDGVPECCYVGRIVMENKGIGRMLKVVGKRKITFIGEPDLPVHQAEFRSFLNRTGQASTVSVTKPIVGDNVALAREMCKYKYHMFDAKHASFGHSMLEALCCDRVCVVTGGLAMNWAKGGAYYTATLKDMDTFEPRGREWALKTFNQTLIKEQWSWLLDRAERRDF